MSSPTLYITWYVTTMRPQTSEEKEKEKENWSKSHKLRSAEVIPFNSSEPKKWLGCKVTALHPNMPRDLLYKNLSKIKSLWLIDGTPIQTSKCQVEFTLSRSIKCLLTSEVRLTSRKECFDSQMTTHASHLTVLPSPLPIPIPMSSSPFHCDIQISTIPTIGITRFRLSLWWLDCQSISDLTQHRKKLQVANGELQVSR